MSRTRTRKRPTARTQQHTPAVAAAPTEPHLRPVPPTGTRPGVSLTKPKPQPLPRRHDDFMPLPAIRAHLAARIAGLPTPGQIRDWIPARTDGTGATWNRGTHGTLAHTPDGPSPFFATIPCQFGIHDYLITDGRSLQKAEFATWSCASGHGADEVLAARAKALGDGVLRAHSATADTVQTDVHELRDTHATENEPPKEHPADD